VVTQGLKRTATGTLRVPTQGIQKPPAGTKKILVQGSVPPAGITTQFASGADERAGATPSKTKLKALLITIAVGVGLLLLGGLGYYMTHQAAKSQASLIEEAQKMEVESDKLRASLGESLRKIEKINVNAQKAVARVKSQASQWKSGDENRRKQAEVVLASGERIQTLFYEADSLCTQVEQLKFDSLLPQAIDQQEVNSRKRSLSAQLEHAKAMKAKVDEIERLFKTIQAFHGG
jgi:regulator of replication initiation timing